MPEFLVYYFGEGIGCDTSLLLHLADLFEHHLFNSYKQLFTDSAKPSGSLLLEFHNPPDIHVIECHVHCFLEHLLWDSFILKVLSNFFVVNHHLGIEVVGSNTLIVFEHEEEVSENAGTDLKLLRRSH